MFMLDLAIFGVASLGAEFVPSTGALIAARAGLAAASSAIMQNAPAARAGMAASIEEVSHELGGGAVGRPDRPPAPFSAAGRLTLASRPGKQAP